MGRKFAELGGKRPQVHVCPLTVAAGDVMIISSLLTILST